MQRRFDTLVSWACPHCLAELLLSLDQIRQEQSIRCNRCGTDVELRADDETVLPPPSFREHNEDMFLQ